MAATLESTHHPSDSTIYAPLKVGVAGPKLGANPTLASPFETPEGSDTTDVDTRSEGSVDSEVKINMKGYDNGVEETLDKQSTTSPHVQNGGSADATSSTDASKETLLQHDVVGPDAIGPNRNSNNSVTEQNVTTARLTNLNEASTVEDQTAGSSDSHLKRPAEDSTSTQSLAHGEDLASNESIESKDSAKKQDTSKEDGSGSKDAVTCTSLQATTPALKDTPRSGESPGDINGYGHNAGHSLEHSTENKTPSQGIYASKHAPPASQSERLPHVGAFVQKFEHLPRAPRRPQFGNQPQHDRIDPRDDARMTQAQVRKLQQTLNEERKANKVELERVEVRARSRYETALQQITSGILGQRAALVQQTVHLKECELNLNAREALTRKIEHLLAIGQKQLAGEEADDQELEMFINVNEEIIRERVMHEVRRRDRQVDAQLAIKREKLNHREATIELREKAYSTMYKAQVAESLQEDIRTELQQATAARENSEYGRGLVEGKALGQAEGNEELRQNCYDKGFAACQSIADRMKRFQAGLLAPDSPELAFLFDQSHPDNPFTRGLRMGRRDVATSSQASPASNESDSPVPVPQSAGLAVRHEYGTVNGNAVDTPTPSHPYAHLNGRVNGHVNGITAGHENGHEGVSNGRPSREQEGGPVRAPPHAFRAPAKPHPYASAHTNGYTTGSNGAQNSMEHYSTPLSSADPSPTVDASFGVPLFGTRTAPRPIHPSLQSQFQSHSHQSQLLSPQTPTTNGTMPNSAHTKTHDGTATDSSVPRPNGEVPIFLSGRRLLTYGRVEGEDERAHKADTQVDLIDLY